MLPLSAPLIRPLLAPSLPLLPCPQSFTYPIHVTTQRRQRQWWQRRWPSWRQRRQRQRRSRLWVAGGIVGNCQRHCWGFFLCWLLLVADSLLLLLPPLPPVLPAMLVVMVMVVVGVGAMFHDTIQPQTLMVYDAQSYRRHLATIPTIQTRTTPKLPLWWPWAQAWSQGLSHLQLPY